ncbi:MATE family efflux transporter [Pseudoramibacter sp.]|uniref:MATE family efflux transporter n=1 Tax=Pseudoramibacter sp. TaxID=2034862 RepID=UPI0025E5D069|nr:MATE family efflux transporter [Pseudoramibacter sp.]MCH4071800.1 MATE family efflux transporter [Pseudoramibacter sp.]MCH4105568.1 MATE family efflux transporter [Pseudoramibacter sp.]
MHQAQSIDMLHDPLPKNLILFALPIAFSSILQQLFNAADTAVAGRFAGAGALAAVGINSEVVALLVSLSAGLAVGANVWIAHLIGRNKRRLLAGACRHALLLALFLGVLGMGLGLILAAPLLILMRTPKAILPQAILYLRLYLLGYPALVVYDFAAAVRRAQGDSWTPFLILIFSGILNVALNLLFVIAFHLDVAGVALATSLANAAAALMVLSVMKKQADQSFSGAGAHKTLHFSRILAVGVPAALQGAVFCVANLFVQTAVNGFGPDIIAGSAIAVNFEYIGYYMITAFGQTATTFTAQNAAAGEAGRCRRSFRLCTLDALAFSAAVVVPITIFKVPCAALFSNSPGVVAAAGVRITIIFAPEILCGLYEVPAGVLRGRGHSALPAALTILGICGFRLFWIFAVFAQNQTPERLYFAFPVSWLLTIVLMGIAVKCTLSRPVTGPSAHRRCPRR